MEALISVLHGTIRMATPIALVALGGVFTHRAGVLNIAMEGMMLMGAFAGVIASYLTGSILAAILAAVVVAVLFSLILSFFGVTLKGNLIVTGLAVNILALGTTSYILQVVFNRRGVFSDKAIVGINPIHIPGIDIIPILGPVLNDHTPLVYFSFIALILVSLIIYKTKYGIYVRTVGENVEAARSVGIKVNLIQYSSLIISGVFCGLAGVSLSLENLSMFVENMTNGRGFIALAAIFCGKGTPVGAFIFSLLFGLADAVQMRLQSFNIPGAFVQMIPFIFIIVVLTVVAIYKNRNITYRGEKQ